MAVIGIPKEIKILEFRVGGTTAVTGALVKSGHEVIIETNAGQGVNITDEQYQKSGAKIVSSAKEVYEKADIILKVKEPQPVEYSMLKEGQTIFSYLHLAPDPEQTKGLIYSGCHAIAFETVTDDRGTLPLLTPMSEIAGRISVQQCAKFLEKVNGGKGRLLGAVPGIKPCEVVIVGGGVAGYNASVIAKGMGARVTILDKSLPRLRQLQEIYGSSVDLLFANPENTAKAIAKADAVIGAVLVPGDSAPKVVSREMIASMQDGSVVADIAIDQGGCFETSKPTNHQDPVYVEEGVIHYCVTNMPGIVPMSSTFALENAVTSYILELANKGVVKALQENKHLRNGLNVAKGKVTNQEVARALGYEYSEEF